MTVGSQAYPYGINSSGNILLASQTLSARGAPITVSGETISEDASSSEIIVASGGVRRLKVFLGQIIASALGKIGTPSGDAGPEATNASFTGVAFTGKASRRADIGDFIWKAFAVGFLLRCMYN